MHSTLARISTLLLVVLVAGGCSLCRDSVPDRVPIYSVRATEGELRAGAAAVDITPEEDVYMGGFSILRESRGVHDPLYARALVLVRGELEMILVSVDLVGLMRPEVLEILGGIPGLDPRHVILASTHDHHSPDTMGIWGFPPFSSGSSPEYMALVKRGVVSAIEAARASLRPAELGAAKTVFEPKGFIKNASRPGLVDPEVPVLHLREAGGGATVATLFELGCHPEAIKRKNREISADFPSWAVAKVEAALGGVAIYVSGALGALVSPDRHPSGPDDPLAWREAERIGNLLGDHALSAVHAIEAYERSPKLELWHTPVYLENENWRYDMLNWTGIVDREVFDGGYFETEVNLWKVGELAIASVPGEISPDLGLRIKRAIGADKSMIIGLANDELGYLVPPWDYDMSWYDYERTLCLGREAGWVVFVRLEDLALMAHYRGD